MICIKNRFVLHCDLEVVAPNNIYLACSPTLFFRLDSKWLLYVIVTAVFNKKSRSTEWYTMRDLFYGLDFTQLWELVKMPVASASGMHQRSLRPAGSVVRKKIWHEGKLEPTWSRTANQWRCVWPAKEALPWSCTCVWFLTRESEKLEQAVQCYLLWALLLAALGPQRSPMGQKQGVQAEATPDTLHPPSEYYCWFNSTLQIWPANSLKTCPNLVLYREAHSGKCSSA